MTGSVEQLSRAVEQVAEGSQAQVKVAEDANGLGGRVAEPPEDMAMSAQAASGGTKVATKTVEGGVGMVQNMIDGIGRIKATVDTAAEEISRLGDRSAEIGDIVAVIDDIAAQTNLLALDAAIEAARARERARLAGRRSSA